MSLISNKIPPKLYTLSAVGIGFLLIDESNLTEQNALGNWLMLIAQVLCTNSYFVELKNQPSNKINLSNEDTVIMMQKVIDAINKELDKINKNN